jgi:hypothetical protein
VSQAVELRSASSRYCSEQNAHYRGTTAIFVSLDFYPEVDYVNRCANR